MLCRSVLTILKSAPAAARVSSASSAPGARESAKRTAAGSSFSAASPQPGVLAALLGAKALVVKANSASTRANNASNGTPPLFALRHVHMPSSARVWACAAAPGARRAMSSGNGDGAGNDVVIYSSKSESILRAFSIGSVAQGGCVSLMAAAVSLHPAAANSSYLPGWTASGRGALSGLLLGFGAAIVIGCKGFLGKQILKVASIPNAPDDINVYMLSFPFGTQKYRVPKKEFYVITAAFGEFDLEKEANGPAPILPVYVGGTVRQTLMIDIRGDFIDKDMMNEIMVCSPEDQAGGDWDAKADELLKKPFIPNKVKKDI